MGYSYYLFALFVFTLAVLVIIIGKKVKGSKEKYSESIAEKEKRIFKLYQSLEDMISGAVEFIEEAKQEVAKDKKDTAESLKKANELIAKLKEQTEKIEKIKESNDEMSAQNADRQGYNKPVLISKEMSKNEKVLLLRKEGQNIEQISKVLGMSQGEVRLIIGLNR